MSHFGVSFRGWWRRRSNSAHSRTRPARLRMWARMKPSESEKQSSITMIREESTGRAIRLFQYDYGYRVPEAVTTYKSFRDYDKVVMVLGWGTGDTESLSPTINADKMPYLSSSFQESLRSKKTPYNFVYGSIIRPTPGRDTYWFEEVWKKDPKWQDLRGKGLNPSSSASSPRPPHLQPLRSRPSKSRLHDTWLRDRARL